MKLNTHNYKYKVADVVIDPAQSTISINGEAKKVELRAMQVLVCLINHAGESVSRDMLIEQVWSGGHISDNAINRLIGLLRNLLGDSAKSPKFIKTLPKIGYVFIADLEKLVAKDAIDVQITVVEDYVQEKAALEPQQATTTAPQQSDVKPICFRQRWWQLKTTNKIALLLSLLMVMIMPIL